MCFTGSAFESDLAQSQISSYILQFTVTAFLARKAVLGMIGQQQFYDHSSCCADFIRIRFHYHTFCNRINTGGYKRTRSGSFYDTQSAGPFRSKFRMIAQRRNMNAGRTRGFKNSSIFRGLYSLPIDR